MKRHEVLVKHYKKAEEEAAENWETLDSLTNTHFRRGILSEEEFSELVEYRDAYEGEYLEAMTRRYQAEFNTRRSHVAYCRARMSVTLNARVVTYRESLSRAEVFPRIVTEIHSPVLTLLANSLPTHAPPQELASITETLSS
jgi:hypothetical protein